MSRIETFARWLENTPPSLTMQSHEWMVPAVQSVHLFCLAIVFASMVMFDMRLIGLAGRTHAIGDMAKRFFPPLWIALTVMLITGMLLIVAEPGRELFNPMFWTKMILIVAAASLTWLVGRQVRIDPAYWDERRHLVRAIGVVALLFWVGILFCGRWIAYYDVM